MVLVNSNLQLFGGFDNLGGNSAHHLERDIRRTAELETLFCFLAIDLRPITM